MVVLSTLLFFCLIVEKVSLLDRIYFYYIHTADIYVRVYSFEKPFQDGPFPLYMKFEKNSK